MNFKYYNFLREWKESYFPKLHTQDTMITRWGRQGGAPVSNITFIKTINN